MLAVSGNSGFPTHMQSLSGNAADQTTLYEAAKKVEAIRKGIMNAPSFFYVADSSMYDRAFKEGADLKWITRVPERHK